MWYFCMMPESKLSPVSFQVWLLQYTIYTFTLVCEIQHYHGPLILHRNPLRSHLLHQSSYVALVEYLWAWFASSQKKGCSQTSQKPEQHSLQKRCCNLINRHVAAVCWQNFSCLFSVCGVVVQDQSESSGCFTNFCIYRKIHVSLLHPLVIIDTLSERLVCHTRLNGICGPKS